MKNLTIIFKAEHGSLANIGDLLGTEDINIEGLSGISIENRWIVNILVKDYEKARIILLKKNFKVEPPREVIVFSKSEKNIVGKPGSFGEICRLLTSSGIKIDLAYAAENNKFVFGVDNVKEAKKILKID